MKEREGRGEEGRGMKRRGEEGGERDTRREGGGKRICYSIVEQIGMQISK